MTSLDTTLRFEQQALKLGTDRQQLVASNIANADTPNFKAKDMDFAAALKRVQSGDNPVTLAVSKPGQMAGRPVDNGTVVTLESSPLQPAADGNTVDMDTQQANFAESTIQVQSAFTFLNAQIKTILSALQG